MRGGQYCPNQVHQIRTHPIPTCCCPNQVHQIRTHPLPTSCCPNQVQKIRAHPLPTSCCPNQVHHIRSHPTPTFCVPRVIVRSLRVFRPAKGLAKGLAAIDVTRLLSGRLAPERKHDSRILNICAKENKNYASNFLFFFQNLEGCELRVAYKLRYHDDST